MAAWDSSAGGVSDWKARHNTDTGSSFWCSQGFFSQSVYIYVHNTQQISLMHGPLIYWNMYCPRLCFFFSFFFFSFFFFLFLSCLCKFSSFSAVYFLCLCYCETHVTVFVKEEKDYKKKEKKYKCWLGDTNTQQHWTWASATRIAGKYRSMARDATMCTSLHGQFPVNTAAARTRYKSRL